MKVTRQEKPLSYQLDGISIMERLKEWSDSEQLMEIVFPDGSKAVGPLSDTTYMMGPEYSVIWAEYGFRLPLYGASVWLGIEEVDFQPLSEGLKLVERRMD